MPASAVPQTPFHKLWQRHLVEQTDDGEALLDVERHLVYDMTGPQAFQGLRIAGRRPRRRERRHRLLDGLDPIGLTLAKADAIRADEARRRALEPWLFVHPPRHLDPRKTHPP